MKGQGRFITHSVEDLNEVWKKAKSIGPHRTLVLEFFGSDSDIHQVKRIFLWSLSPKLWKCSGISSLVNDRQIHDDDDDGFQENVDDEDKLAPRRCAHSRRSLKAVRADLDRPPLVTWILFWQAFHTPFWRGFTAGPFSRPTFILYGVVRFTPKLNKRFVFRLLPEKGGKGQQDELFKWRGWVFPFICWQC